LTLKDSPQITRHPESQLKDPGTPVNFLVTASGTPPLLFQWQKDGVDIDGATSKIFTIESVSKTDEGAFICRVTNNAGSISSNPAVLGVNDPVKIIQHPQSRTKSPGEIVTFSVTASGTSPLSFQWEKDSIDISGATANNYTIASIQKNDVGVYKCKVSNNFSNIISNSADLILIYSPQITRHPQSQLKNLGTLVNFLVTASGTPPLLFQWQKDGVDIDGATSKSFTINSVSKTDEGAFICKVTNNSGSISSNPAVLNVIDPVKIIQHPQSSTKSPGEAVTFSVTASGTSPLSFQWEKDRIDISGATANSYTIASVQDNDVGVYKCKVSNDFSSIISNRADLTLINSPQITRHPESQLKNPGTPVTFSVTASGTPPLLFQWQKDGVDIDGATSNSFTIDFVSENEEGFFSCSISNDAGSVVSNEAELLIIIPPQIRQHPRSQLKDLETPVTFSVTVSGTPPLSFQWQKDGVILEGETKQTYTIDSVSVNDEGYFSCNVSNNAGSLRSFDAELYVNVPFLKEAASPVTEPVKSGTDKLPKPSISSGTSKSTDAIDSRVPKQLPFIIKDLFLNTPSGQGDFVYNGNTLTCKGSAFPNANLVSARLEDEQARLIRDVSKSLKIAPDTGDINGSIFVGSFRGAETVHLRIEVQAPVSSQLITGTSNTLFIDQVYPEVRIAEPKNHSYFDTTPIVIYGTASDDLSGIATVKVSTDGGSTYRNVDFFKNGQWLYSFTPKTTETEFKIKVRSTDNVGLATVSDVLTIHCEATPPSIKKTAQTYRNQDNNSYDNTGKSDDEGICTYRIINQITSRFQPTDIFSLNEHMAIIVKGYGGKMVTVKIIDPSLGKIIFELSDYIPPNKNKMWKWKLTQSGKFQAALFVDGNYEDAISFKIIQ
jgi:hypothetical protein